MVEDKTLFTSLLRPKTADTVRGASARSYCTQCNRPQSREPVKHSAYQQKLALQKDISDKIDAL